jgi:hypothetical protein
MRLSKVRHVLLALPLVVGASWLGAIRPAAAQSTEPSNPPSNIDVAHPTVSGTLVAKPVSGEGNIPAACRDRDDASLSSAVMQHRGLVVCTAEGKLVLLNLQPNTGPFYRYWGEASLYYFRDGDHVNAWGVLRDHGYELDPTFAVQDTDAQQAYTDSQDFIMAGGLKLTLGVLKSPAGSPVQGIVYAIQGGPTSITLCNGSAGTWASLKTGKTIDITDSLLNRRLHEYIHTANVTIVSCP